MKTLKLFFLTLTFSINATSQEWMTSLEVAKSLASVQNKMIFMMWEESTYQYFPVFVNNNGIEYRVDLFESENINEIIWEYFVPVKVGEHMYDQLFKEIEGKRKLSYIERFNDDGIKIMDVNGNILNLKSNTNAYINFTRFIDNYGLNTSFLKTELKNYKTHKNFSTAYRLASKYLDFSIYVNTPVRIDIIKLSDLYLNEAKKALLNPNNSSNDAYQQKIELLGLKKYLILNKPKRVLRVLKKFNTTEVNKINKPLEAFLYYAAYKLLEHENEAELWKSKVSLVDLQYTQLIININS